MSVAPPGRQSTTRLPTWLERPRSWLLDPARTFLTVGLVVGLGLAVAAPSFSGIDEPSHFARAARMAEGHPLPDAAVAGTSGDGECLPRPLLREIGQSLVRYQYGPEARLSDAQIDARFPACGDDRGFFAAPTFAWYSPLGYAPQAVAVAAARLVGAPAGVQLLFGRLATLAVYLALVTVAIRRIPTGRWALAAVGLLPVALFEAATSVSPDALTTALVIFVLSSALAAAARPSRIGTAAFLAESIVASVALGLAKPTYVVFALAYLLPLITGPRRSAFWQLGLPVVVGGGLSTLWYRSQHDRFACDVTFFGIQPDPDRQIDSLVHGPQQLVTAGARALPEHGRSWLVDAFAVGDRVTPWLLGVGLVGFAVFVVVAAQRTPDETLEPGPGLRLGLAGLAVLGYLAVLSGWLIYCSAPGWTVANPPHTRLLLPVLPALVLAIAPCRAWARRLGGLTVPPALGLVAFDVAFLATAAVHLRTPGAG